MSFRYILVALNLLHLGSARSALYGSCDVKNNHLDVNTKAFITDCDSFGYCSINGTCLPRQCRRDEYILSSLLNTDIPVPPLCPSGTFCPDDASACLPLVEVDGQCELNRDDECASPPQGMVLVVPNPYDEIEGDGSLCLLGKCMWANATLGQTCITESTTYIGYDPSGMSFTNTVIRDNCIEGQGYCDTNSNTCFPLLNLHQSCSTDRQCQSFNCEREFCTVPPESSVKVGKWVYALTGISVGLGMIGVLSLLLLMHRRAQKTKRIMLEEYYKEQVGFRNSIISFHSALSYQSEKSGNAKSSVMTKEEIKRTLSSMSETTLVGSRR
ncbi:uncharacterized protein L201_004160 [Kwoniella dendrophila CBS 6074]|uniref:Dickkopf N-terminal cysteine-rich domain-containing protein n=1 Tax=Kwoniella dendrophila CBS 6074 TaxID=1295534 RepID=A0AAX4JVG8_9TREE